MNNSDFQKLTAHRLKEAKVLLRNRCYAGSYYLAGYVIECALKSCISSKTNAGDFPPKPNVVNECYKHDLSGLMRLAGLEGELEKRRQSPAPFASNWETIRRWTEQVRYETNISRNQAEALIQAVSRSKHGLLKWLKMYW